MPDKYPILKYFYTDFEYNYDTGPGVQFAKDNWPIPIALVTIYMVRTVQKTHR